MNTKRGLSAAVAAVLSTGAGTGVAVAQQSGAAMLEEVVVTARRVEESITDAPVAVAVMDNDFLESNRIDNIQEILEMSPGATWGQFTAAQPSLTLRGINGGNFGNSSLESAVQSVYDGIPLTKAFMMTAPVFDLARVEIMRGPQGTTFGRNATIGLMHLVSARPTDEFDAGVSVTAGTLDLAGIEGFVNGSLSDTISGRLAFKFQDTDGAVEDAITGNALEGSEQTAIRGSLLIEPNDNFSAYLKAELISDDMLPVVRRGSETTGQAWLNPNAFGGYVAPSDPFKAEIDQTRTDWRTDRDMTFLTAELNWNLSDDLSLTWLSGYQDGDHSTIQDAFGTPFAIRDQIVDNDATVLSTEVRLDNYASGNRMRWLVGAQYLTDEETRVEENVQFPERGLPNGLCGPRADRPGGCPEWNLFTRSLGETESLGLFGEIQFDLTDQLTLAVGARYTDDTRDYDYSTWGWGEAGGLNALGLGNGARDCNANAIPDPLGRVNGPNGVYNVCGTEAAPMGFDDVVSQSWDDTSGKISLSYEVNDNNTVYVLYSEGFKAGGFQHDARNFAHLNDNLVNPEGAENFEFGWKGSYDSLLFAITVFSMEQTDAQVNVNVPAGVGSTGNVTLVRNTGGIENTGIEFEATWAATENLRIGGSIGSYDAEYGPGSLQGGAFDPLTGTFTGEDISGTQPNNSPDLTYAVYADYAWSLSNGSSIRLRGDMFHRSEMWDQAGATNRGGLNLAGTGFMYVRPELDKIGMNLSWTNAAENLTVSLWGRNLDDDPDFINRGPGIGFIFNNGQPGANGEVVRSRPVGVTGRKQVGVTASYSF